MVKKLIKTKKDYEAALARIEELMDAKAGSPEGDELELLTALVELYEESRFPVRLPDPIDAVLFRIEQLGMNRQNLVPYLGSRSKISEVLSRKKPLSLSMMRALHEGLGIPAEILLKEPRAEFPSEFADLEWDRFPLKEMARRGLIESAKDIKSKAEELIRQLIQEAGDPQTISAVLFRKGRSSRQNTKSDQYALWAWCLQVMILARQSQPKQKYLKGSLSSEVLRDVAKLSYLENGPVLAKEYLAKLGVVFIVVPHFLRTHMDGASFLLENGTPVVALTLRYDRIDYFWFCLLHELGHVILHLSTANEIIIDDLNMRRCEMGKADTKEQEADRLAEEALAPKKLMEKAVLIGHLSSINLETLARSIKVHPAIIAGRIRHETRNYRLFTKYVGAGQIRELFSEYKTSIRER